MAQSVLTFLRRNAAWARRWPERILHPLRRRRLKQSLQAEEAPGSLLFLCLGNICRSPFAALLAREAIADSPAPQLRVDSAGFIGPGRPSPDLAVEVAAAQGVDLSEHRSKLVTPEMIQNRFDAVVVFDPAHRRRLIREFGASPARIIVLGDLDPESVERRAIADPYSHDREFFEACYARIRRCLQALLEVLDDPGRAKRPVTSDSSRS